MNDNVKTNNRFIMNEYLEVEVKQKQLELCKECYHALGWTTVNTNSGISKVTIRLQRDRKIKNREQLSILQKSCEGAFKAIEQLEDAKTRKAMSVSLGLGMIGTAFMACSVFSL